MEKIKKDWRKKVPITTINDDLKKYKNDPFFLKKLDEANKLIARIGLPPEFYERQAAAYKDALSSAEPLATLNEPQAEYGVPKDIEE